MRITRKLLARVEGEAVLELEWEKGRIKSVRINFPFFRNVEGALVGRPLMDALVIVPRVCGICGHAHLLAAVFALEELLGSGEPPKALILRKLTLILEILQNHLKWFYLFLMPEFLKLRSEYENLYRPFKGKSWVKGLQASSLVVKAIGTLAGQWPHNSYAVPGGITSQPFSTEISKAEAVLVKLLHFVEDNLIGLPLGEYLSLRGKALVENCRGDLGRFFELAFAGGFQKKGRSYGRFLAGGFPGLFPPGVFNGKSVRDFEEEGVKEFEAEPNLRRVRYYGVPHEVGPLARKVVTGEERVISLLDRHGDSVLVRVFARIDEIVTLTVKALELVRSVRAEERSYIKPPQDPEKVSGEGTGIVEAARGTLIHRIRAEKGRIKSYEIITPSQWNLAPGDAEFMGVAEKAIVGLSSETEAIITLRSFDLCSVCTVH
ncbi:MAG: nickel-dependent hydrogenase large subunit [Aquificae bacterium]|nr:nickel-dependent hydrogenase large subunit [Aquificota bacterium]